MSKLKASAFAKASADRQMSKRCSICGRGPTIGFNRPKSLHRTKRIVFINLQKKEGQLICARCLKKSFKALGAKNAA